MEVSISVYNCKSQSAKIGELAETIDSSKFDIRVQPWADGCPQSEYPRYHFLARAGDGNILGWMTADIRTHAPKPGRKWTYVYLDKVSARKGTTGVGRALGEYLKTWAKGRGVDFIWLWAINEQVSAVYEASWRYKRVQYYDGYGFMFYTISRSPPLSMLQSVLPEHPRVYWVAADMVSKMEPPNERLSELIATNRRGHSIGVKTVLETLMDTLKDLSPEEVKGVQQQLLDELSKEGGRRTRRAQPQTKKAAKKTCYPGYEVYNFRKNSRGVFYNCLPKKRKTRRRYK